jgi:Tfp pilus assembly protein PilZ
MTASEQPYSTIPRLFELINDLTEEEQLDLLKQLLKDDIKTHLFKLVVSMTEDKQKTLVKQLEETIQKRGERKYARKSCLINVDYAVGGRAFSNYIQDISTTGVFIETSESFTEGQTLLITFSFPDMEDALKIDGEITRITSEGIGVRFDYQSQIQRDVVEQLVEKMKEH